VFVLPLNDIEALLALLSTMTLLYYEILSYSQTADIALDLATFRTVALVISSVFILLIALNLLTIVE